MCGIVGYIGSELSRSHVLHGLGRLEYRGYDSSGFAFINESGELRCIKSPGGLSKLVTALNNEASADGNIGLGHMRWSTHGATTHENAHPHSDCKNILQVAHNGIIENHLVLREELSRAEHVFISQTDTEVIAHLLEDLLAQGLSLPVTLQKLVSQLQGAYALAIIFKDHPKKIAFVRKASPLCIGLGKNAAFVASDQIAFAEQAESVIAVPDATFGFVEAQNFELFNFQGERITIAPKTIDRRIFEWLSDGKGGFSHFMLKEMYEQRSVIQRTARAYQAMKLEELLNKIGITEHQASDLNEIVMVACGTSWHAARIAQFFFESVAKIPAHAFLASEFRYMPFFANKKALYIFITQSGETADTLEALRMVHAAGMHTVSLTNAPMSTAAREANGFLLGYSGQEVAVASTKSFSAQLAVLFTLSHAIGYYKKLISADQLEKSYEDLHIAAEILEATMQTYDEQIKTKIAPTYLQAKQCIFLGRHITFPLALEAALKLKEISYIFAECYPAGELKHGHIALIDEHVPVVIFSSPDLLIYQKLLSNAQEVKARHGHIIAFIFEGQSELEQLADVSFVFPKSNHLLSGLTMIGVTQLFVYHIALLLGRPIDKPRNLAKTVTVE